MVLHQKSWGKNLVERVATKFEVKRTTSTFHFPPSFLFVRTLRSGTGISGRVKLLPGKIEALVLVTAVLVTPPDSQEQLHGHREVSQASGDPQISGTPHSTLIRSISQSETGQ